MSNIQLASPGEIVTHTTKAIAEEEIKPTKALRYKQILEILGDNTMTAKEVAVEMYKRGYTDSTDRNCSAPRLTELMYKMKVEAIGKKKCQYTGKTVAVYRRVVD